MDMNRLYRLVPASLVVIVLGCSPRGEDNWRHYKSGGHYKARTPCMSPDGTVVVFSSPRTGRGDIYLIDRNGGNRTRLTDSQAFETDPIFSPDGSTIAFTREFASRRHIWLIDSDGSNPRQLTSGSVLDNTVSFSPDGSELNFFRTSMSMNRATTAQAVNIESGILRKLEALPEYSPDGKLIALCYPNESGDNEIWLMQRDGSNKRFLVRGHSPRFSPDGCKILFSTENTHPGSLWKVCKIDGSDNWELGRVEHPIFARDGKHIVCLSPEWKRRIWKVALDGSKRQELHAPTGYIDFFRPCRDGFVVKLVTNDRVGDIYIINTDEWTVEKVASMR